MTTQPISKQQEHENVVPFRPLSMLEEMERMFESVVPHNWMRPLRWDKSLLGDILPQVDVVERDDSILLRAAIPGVSKDDLEVSTTDHTVTIRGRSRKEEKEETGEYYRHEISSGSFLRTVTLPATVDENTVKATFKDGMLELTLPKLESAKRHTVKIEQG